MYVLLFVFQLSPLNACLDTPAVRMLTVEVVSSLVARFNSVILLLFKCSCLFILTGVMLIRFNDEP